MSNTKSASQEHSHDHHHDHHHHDGHDCSSHSHAPIQRSEPKVGRNDACPCQSGKKYKKCCLQ